MVMFTRTYIFKVDETKNLEKGEKKTASRSPCSKTCEAGARGGFVWKGNKELHHYESGTTNASSKTKTAINYSTGTE